MTRRVRNFLTVDVEEWFHICGVDGPLAFDRWPSLPSRVEYTTDLALDLLARRGLRATFFVLGWIADRYPGLVARIVSAGHEVGSHGWSHRRVYELDEVSFEEELTRTDAALEAAGAPRPIGYRAPEWSINDRSLWALAVLARHGFRYDSSMAPLRLIGNPRYPQVPHRRETAGGPLLEVPPLVRPPLRPARPARRRMGAADEPARGGRQGDRRAQSARRSRSTIFVHPWELDPSPPRVDPAVAAQVQSLLPAERVRRASQCHPGRRRVRPDRRMRAGH